MDGWLIYVVMEVRSEVVSWVGFELLIKVVMQMIIVMEMKWF